MAFKNTYYIVAANVKEYNDWLTSDRPNHIIPEKATGEFYHIRYVSSPDILRGLSDIKGFYLPGCERHLYYNTIRSVIETIKAGNRVKIVSVNNNVITGNQIHQVWVDEYDGNR
jgi:hypothetical protein